MPLWRGGQPRQCCKTAQPLIKWAGTYLAPAYRPRAPSESRRHRRSKETAMARLLGILLLRLLGLIGFTLSRAIPIALPVPAPALAAPPSTDSTASMPALRWAHNRKKACCRIRRFGVSASTPRGCCAPTHSWIMFEDPVACGLPAGRTIVPVRPRCGGQSTRPASI